MSNNISRKGLAFGALVAIVTSLFAGAPAQAAEVVALDSTYGTSLVVPAGDTFTLTATIDSGSYQSLNVRVDNLDAAAATVITAGAGSHAVATSDARYETGAGAFTANSQTLSIRGTSTDKTSRFQVTVYRDWHNAGTLDADEASVTKTVTFLKAADIAATTSFVTYPTYTNDARSISARVELTNVNTAQVRNSASFASTVTLSIRVGTYDVRNSLATPTAATVSISGDNRFYGSVLNIANDSDHWFAGAVYTAQAYVGTATLGSAVSTAAITNVDPTAVAIATVVGANALAAVSNSATVRQNSAFQVKATLTGDSKAAIAGQSVSFTVDGSWTTGTARVTVGTDTYATSADLRAATIKATADADGVATISVSVTGFGTFAADAANALTFVAKSGTRSSATLTAKPAAAAATTVAATPAAQAVVLGSAASVSVTLKDQFGEAVNTGYVAQAKYNDGPGTSASETYKALTNGAATLALTVDGTVTGSTRYTIQARAIAEDGSLGATVSPVSVLVVTRAAADLVSGYIKIGADTETLGVRTAAARVSVDAKTLVGASASAFTATAQSISGRVVISGDRGTPYAKVTLAGTGLFFVNADGKFDASSTVATADVAGYFTVTVRSNTTGTATVKVTSGSAAAQSISWTVDAPSAQDGTVVVSANDATQTLLVGKTATVTFSARDTFGNTVTSYTGNPTITVHVSGDVTRDVYGVDANGAITVSGVAPSATGTAYFTVTLSNDARVVTAQVRVDWAKEVVTVDAPEAATAGQNVDVVVTVLDPAGDPVKGYEITATSTGVGNLTVAKATTDVNGQAYLKLFAATNELGWAYVTATSTTGSVVADVAGVQFQAAPTATDNVATLALAVPATAQAGTVVDVVATATDADGNAVQGAVVSATSTGVGYLAVASGTTDADGKVTLKLVVTAGENGTASVSAAAGDVTADAVSVTAGVTDANITLAKKRVTVDWSFAANKKVVIVRDGVVIKSFTASSNAADSFSFNLKNGTRKVSVKVGGVTLDSQTYKIK